MKGTTEQSPLKPIDCGGRCIRPGDEVEIQSVASCVKELPEDDRERLLALVGNRRRIVEFDRFGFVWLCFSAAELQPDFCLFPAETKRA